MRDYSSEFADELDELELDEDSDDFTDEQRERLAALRELRDSLPEGFDTRLIAEGDFKEYAEEVTDNLGDIPDWLRPHIDWQSVADDMQSDYTTVEFDGETLLYQ